LTIRLLRGGAHLIVNVLINVTNHVPLWTKLALKCGRPTELSMVSREVSKVRVTRADSSVNRQFGASRIPGRQWPAFSG
jgi:hypothetical protein